MEALEACRAGRLYDLAGFDVVHELDAGRIAANVRDHRDGEAGPDAKAKLAATLNSAIGMLIIGTGPPGSSIASQSHRFTPPSPMMLYGAQNSGWA